MQYAQENGKSVHASPHALAAIAMAAQLTGIACMKISRRIGAPKLNRVRKRVSLKHI